MAIKLKNMDKRSIVRTGYFDVLTAASASNTFSMFVGVAPAKMKITSLQVVAPTKSTATATNYTTYQVNAIANGSANAIINQIGVLNSAATMTITATAQTLITAGTPIKVTFNMTGATMLDAFSYIKVNYKFEDSVK